MGIAMRDLMRDPERRRRMGEVGRRRFESELAWDYSRTALVAFYDRLLGGHAA
jgi:glycosyltransferase involved in cell wall biosynthesis